MLGSTRMPSGSVAGLGELGVTVAFTRTVGDTLQHNVDVFRIACERADVVVSTGGLGPTRDDLTRDALAALGGSAAGVSSLGDGAH